MKIVTRSLSHHPRAALNGVMLYVVFVQRAHSFALYTTKNFRIEKSVGLQHFSISCKTTQDESKSYGNGEVEKIRTSSESD